MPLSKKAETPHDNRISGVHEAPIDSAALAEVSQKIGKSIRARVITCLRRERRINEGEETNSELLSLYENIIRHPYFKDGIISIQGIAEPTLFAIELYLYKKGLIEERLFAKIIREKMANKKNRPAYLDID